jgi:hypothetical protein
MARVALGLAALALLAGCARNATQQVNQGYSLPPPAQPQRPPDQAEPGEAVWHLRAGLNVAALSCRGKGRTPVAKHYSRVLSRHKVLLAKAYAGEQRRFGKGLDRHQTRIYNRFSNQKNPAQFCAAAATVAKQVIAMDSPTLAQRAPTLLGKID